MSLSYYDRGLKQHSDGTKTFQTERDKQNEADVASAISAAWNCSLKQFGALSPIDWFAERHGRLVGLLELKSRSHESGKYGTVFLNVRKWLALSLGSVGLGVQSTFVVKFTDGIFWIPVASVNAERHMIGGCSRFVKSKSDIEPVIEVAISDLRVLV